MNEHLPLLARQPIFNRSMEVVAYELLWRATGTQRQADAQRDGDMASSQVILNAFTELSFNDLIGTRKAYINFTRSLLLSPPLVNKDRLVIEVLENQVVDRAMLDALAQLRKQGYTIALDDFVLSPETQPLLELADIVKLDILALSRPQLEEHLERLRPYPLKLLAEKVEDHAQLEYCLDAGFDLFQGFFLAKPKVIKGRRLTESKQAVIELLTTLHNPEVDIAEAERCISRDPILSYKLLRLVNSAAFALPRKIESLRQAITLLGLDIIKNWVNLLAMSKLGDKPNELYIAALTRARMCEVIATTSSGRPRQDNFFTVGLLSTLDAFMDMPLEELVASLSLSEKLSQALLAHEGEEGQVLSLVLRYEQANWDDIDWAFLRKRRITPELLTQVYLESLHWVGDVMSDFSTR